jgi:hypothetical protein
MHCTQLVISMAEKPGLLEHFSNYWLYIFIHAVLNYWLKFNSTYAHFMIVPTSALVSNRL